VPDRFKAGKRRSATNSRVRPQAPTRVPQVAQKWAAAGSSVPHSVQCTTAGASAWPQLMQNRAPAGFDAWQEAHAGPAAACCTVGAG
jgi:hypothetical protein